MLYKYGTPHPFIYKIIFWQNEQHPKDCIWLQAFAQHQIYTSTFS